MLFKLDKSLVKRCELAVDLRDVREEQRKKRGRRITRQIDEFLKRRQSSATRDI